jgi:hypothetical protein
VGGVTSYEAKQNSGLPKLRYEASCQKLHGTEVVIGSVANDPFMAPGSTLLYACLPTAWGDGGDYLIPCFLCNHYGPQEIYRKKLAKALAEFKFCSLGKIFWNQATMMRFHYVGYCTFSEVQDYWQNKADWDT